jgi:hypothetical protein
MGLGVMSAEGKLNPTSPIQQHRPRGTYRPKQQNIFSTFVTLSSSGPGGRISNAATTSQALAVRRNAMATVQTINEKTNLKWDF